MSTSNIVPYYSSSPPPLDEDDDTAQSLDDNDDDFGDFSSAPTASTVVGITTFKTPANESVFFRPISKNLQPDPLNDDHFADDDQNDEPPPVSVAKNEPVSCSPVFSNDQFVNDHQKDEPLPDGDASISAGKEQGVINENAADEIKLSSELNCQKQTNKLDAQNFEKTSDLCNSANFGDEFVSHCEDPVKNEEFEHPVVQDVLTDQCSVTDFASINSLDTTVPDALKDPVQESFDLSSVQDTIKQDVVMSAEDDFDDFETFQGEPALKDSHLESVVSEHTAEISVNGDQENFAVDVPDEKCNIKTTNDFEKLQVDADEFDDFEYFQDEYHVKPDSAVTTATSDDVEIAPNKIQDDVMSDTSNSDGKINADDFEEFESAQEHHNFELCQDSVAEDSPLDSVASKADSSDGESLHEPGNDEITVDTSRDNTTEFLENQAAKESTEEIPFKNESESNLETSNVEAVRSKESDEMTASSTDDKQNKKCDFDEFDEFQFADDEVANPPSAPAVCSTASPAATTFKTDDSSSSWSAFSKDSPSDETNEDSWAAFNADTNLSSDLVKNGKQAAESTVEELKTPGLDWKESSIKSSTVDGSQAKFETLTSRVVTNCYPLVMGKDTMQLPLLVEVISQMQELMDNSSKSLSIHTRSTDLTTGENKSCLTDVCVWNNLKMMDLTSAFSFQWPTSSISRHLLSAINVDLSSILVGHKKPQAPLFAPNLGLLEPMKAPTELQIAQADKDSLTFAISDSSSTSSAVMSSAFSPQDVPQLEFDWGGSGLTNPLDATEKERELLDALEPPANESSMKMPPMSLETMMATLLPSIPSTQLIPKSQKDVSRKHLSEEAIQVLSKLPDLSFMQAKVLMFPLKDIASN